MRVLPLRVMCSRILTVLVLVWAPRAIGLHRLDQQCAHAWAFQAVHTMAIDAFGRRRHIVETWGLAACTCCLRLCRVRGPGPVSFAPANVPPRGAGCCSVWAHRAQREGPFQGTLPGGPVLCGTCGPSMQPNRRAHSRRPHSDGPVRRPCLWGCHSDETLSPGCCVRGPFAGAGIGIVGGACRRYIVWQCFRKTAP